MSVLNLHIDGDEHLIAMFNLQIESFLEVGKKLGRIEYRMIVRTSIDDDVIASDPDKPEIEYKRHGTSSLREAVVMTPEVENYMVKLHVERGFSPIHVARIIKCHVATVERLLRRKGVLPSQRLNQEQKIEFVRLYVEDGWSANKIANHFKVAKGTVGRTLVRAGVIKPMSRQENEILGQQFRNLRLVHGATK